MQHYPDALKEKEFEILLIRRAKANGNPPDRQHPHNDTVGLALSGGGIRSAIFSLGVCQALAGAQLFPLFDYLSTVSGGGYAGSFIGRLFTRAPSQLKKALPPDDRPAVRSSILTFVVRILANSQSQPLRWLRENGRYLAPNGLDDAWLGATILLRNWAGLHLVLAPFILLVFLCLNLGRGVLENWLGVPWKAAAGPLGLWWSPYLLLPLGLIPLWAVPTGWAYWLVPPHAWYDSRFNRWYTVVVVVIKLAAFGFLGWAMLARWERAVPLEVSLRENAFAVAAAGLIVLLIGLVWYSPWVGARAVPPGYGAFAYLGLSLFATFCYWLIRGESGDELGTIAAFAACILLPLGMLGWRVWRERTARDGLVLLVAVLVVLSVLLVAQAAPATWLPTESAAGLAIAFLLLGGHVACWSGGRAVPARLGTRTCLGWALLVVLAAWVSCGGTGQSFAAAMGTAKLGATSAVVFFAAFMLVGFHSAWLIASLKADALRMENFSREGLWLLPALGVSMVLWQLAPAWGTVWPRPEGTYTTALSWTTAAVVVVGLLAVSLWGHSCLRVPRLADLDHPDFSMEEFWVFLVLGAALVGCWYTLRADLWGWAGVCLGVAAVALFTLVAYFFAWLATRQEVLQERDLRPRRDRQPHGDYLCFLAGDFLSSWFKTAIGSIVAVLLFAVLDSLGQSLYAVLREYGIAVVGVWVGAVGAGLSTLTVFSQRLAALALGRPEQRRLPLSVNLLAFGAATLLVAAVLVSLDAVAHGFAYGWDVPPGNPGASIIAWWKPPAQGQGPLPPLPSLSAAGGGHDDTRQTMSLPWLLSTCGAVFAVSWFNGWMWKFVNRCSLQALYAERLARTFLGASNSQRWKSRYSNVTRVMPRDGVPLEDYKPHEHGGPLHLINVTINETLDARSQLERRDRKGLGMAVGPCGVSVGDRHHALWDKESRPWTLRPIAGAAEPDQFDIFDPGRDQEGQPIAAEALRLENWVAVSGAAVATGLGAQTSLGLSLLCGMLNVRLGYWWDSGLDPQKRRNQTATGVGPRLAALLSKSFPVQMHLLNEFTARFHGPARRYWYLTDGGHFENMGAYELIRRGVPRIVLCDAEQDGDYTFAGLANLIRKARTDFEAEITFLSSEELDRAVHVPFRRFFGTLDQLCRGDRNEETVDSRVEQGTFHMGRRRKRTLDVSLSRLSRAHAALARVRYKDNPDPGYILYIKPTLMGDEPADVLKYYSDHPRFPHEPTSDQFFAEAQWESYRVLGEHIGTVLFRAIEAVAAPTVPAGGGDGTGERRQQGTTPRDWLIRGTPWEAGRGT